MARISIRDIPAQPLFPETVMLRAEIRRMDRNDISLLMDPETGNWLGIRRHERPLIDHLKSGGDLESLKLRYGDGIFDTLQEMDSKGFLDGSNRVRQALSPIQLPLCRNIRFTVTLTSACNLGCVYCSADAGRSGATMKEETLYQTLDSIFADPDQVHTTFISEEGKPCLFSICFEKP